MVQLRQQVHFLNKLRHSAWTSLRFQLVNFLHGSLLLSRFVFHQVHLAIRPGTQFLHSSVALGVTAFVVLDELSHSELEIADFGRLDDCEGVGGLAIVTGMRGHFKDVSGVLASSTTAHTADYQRAIVDQKSVVTVTDC